MAAQTIYTAGTAAPNTNIYSSDVSSAFGVFQSGDVIISSDLVSTPVWTGDRGTLIGPASGSNQMTTESAQKVGLSGQYYLDVYNITSALISSSNVQFSIAYADIDGSGSTDYNKEVDGYSPSRSNYGQYKALVLGGNADAFLFNAYPSEYFFILSVDRARYKEKLMPGSLKLVLGLSGSADTLTLVDDSKTLQGVSNRSIGTNRYYRLIESGSNADTTVSFGWLLPDIGTVLLDGQALLAANVFGNYGTDPSILGSIRYSGLGNENSLTNATRLYERIKEFTLRSEETVTSNYFFVRARNAEFNYSTNPTFSDSTGNLTNPSMILFPETYITTIGLYNDRNELMAVAKLSKPLPKNFNKEALVRVKLDF